MTREEAIKTIENAKHFAYDKSYIQAFDMAIQALEESCEDAVSRDMALEKMADYVASGYADSVEDFEEYSRIICELPPVKPQEPKTGEWIADVDGYTCSKCGVFNADDDNFCPNCYADMRGENNG